MTTAVISCQRCGRAIVPHGPDRWTHRGADGQTSVGCRAASFVPDKGWDDSLPRSWNAQAPRGSRATDVPMTLSEFDKARASIVAMAVRNAMERIHGGGNELDHRADGGGDHGLTDEQMHHINHIVRDAVATALYAIEHAASDPRCRTYVDFQARLIPSYWEQPELLKNLTEVTRSVDISSFVTSADDAAEQA